MNDLNYDVAIPGNHEFDYGMERFLELTRKAVFPYISCNFNREGELVFAPYIIKEIDGVKLAFVGVTTPETIISSTPRFFQDEEGNYIYGFMPGDDGAELYGAVQKAVDDARGDGADYVILLAHLGNQSENKPYTYADVIEHTNGIDAVLDGHSNTAFDGAKTIWHADVPDYGVAADYIREKLGGVVGDGHENPYGQGRIVAVDAP